MTVPFMLDLDRVFAAPEPWAALAAEREKGWIAESPFGMHVLGFDAAVEVLRDRRFEIDVTTVLDGAGISDPEIRALWPPTAPTRSTTWARSSPVPAPRS